MNVVHVYDGHERVHGGRGGSVPTVVRNNARHVAARGHDVTVLERRWRGTAASETIDGVDIRRFPLPTGAVEPWEDLPYEMVRTPTGALRLLVDRTAFALRARPELDSLDPDIVHVHLPFAANVLACWPSLAGRMVSTAHLGETEARVSDPLVSPDALLARRAARTVALNGTMRDAFRERGVPDDRLVVIPNGVDTDFPGVGDGTRERVEREYDLVDATVVLFVGTLTPRKGVRELVEAAGKILGSYPDARVVIVGKTDMEPAYVEGVRSAASEAGIDDRVTLTGFVPGSDLRGLYACADVFALPSGEEGSSISVAEAVAAGVPVLGTRIDGIRETIDDGTHGVLVEPGDVGALTGGLDRLLADAAERERMADALATRARERSWERVTDRLLDVYRDVAGTATTRADADGGWSA